MANSDFKRFSDLVKDNPDGLEELPVCHNFSNNPGFFVGSAQRPATRPQQSVVPAGRTMGRSSIRGNGSINPAPGSVDPGMDGGPQVMNSGYSG